LIANDFKVVREGLRELMRNQEYDAWEVCGRATNGADVVDKVARLAPDLILLDIGMPCLERGVENSNLAVPVQASPGRLTPREREVVQLVSEGRTTKEVATVLGISVKTAETHRSNIMRKLDFHSVAQLVMYAVGNRIVPVLPPVPTLGA
jgi:DNA-binding NarL/FixJ family response regulator